VPTVIALGALLLAVPGNAAEPVPVVGTFSVIGDMLANVGGDHIITKTIVGSDGDCELYQPTPADVATIASARAVFLNGLNDEFEPWLEPLLKQAEFKGAKVVVTRGVRTLTAEEEHPISGRQLPAAIDQHAWLDPRNGIVYVRNTAEALAHSSPVPWSLSRNGRNLRSASRARSGYNCEPDDRLTSTPFAVSAATSRNSCSAIHLNAAASVGNLRMDRRPLVAAMSTTKTANPSRTSL
jgi:Zinc-uptake complex component A periplasmic